MRFIEVGAREYVQKWSNERKEMVDGYETFKKAINVDYIVSVSDAGIMTVEDGLIPTKENYDEILSKISYVCD